MRDSVDGHLFCRQKIKVNYFQRKPRNGFNFSIEFIFNTIREKLAGKIDAQVFICRQFNDGYYSKVINIIDASFLQSGDVNHITGEVHFLNLLMKKKRVLLTIHDCGMMIRKAGMAQKVIKWLYLSAPVKKAQIIATVSEATKNEIINYTGVNPDKVRVIPVPLNPIFQPGVKIFNNQKPVILHIGTGYNKNLNRLIEAIAGINCHLTIVGELSEEHRLALAENEIEYSNEYNISDTRMLEKYQQCDMLSFVSIFEGFGMPIIEAQAVERVVITSNVSSMPEVAGNGAYLVNPLDVDDIRSGILKLIDDGLLRNSLINNGKLNKLRFGSDKIAAMYLELYEEIAFN